MSRHARHRKWWRAGLVLAAAVALGAPGTIAEAAPGPRTPELREVLNGYAIGAIDKSGSAEAEEAFTALTADDPFYREPRLQGTEKPGTLLRSKQVDMMFVGVKPDGIDAYKLMYVTTGLDGRTPEISTGIMMIPRDSAHARRRVISYQEANDSVGAYCHPSSQWTGGDPLDGSSWSALGPLSLMFDKGYSVVISDVGNNGDRSPHAVFAGKYAAHAQLDAVRAAQQIPAGPEADAEVVAFGIAGGGVGAASAAEQQPRYAPDVNLKGAVLEGMVVKQRSFMRASNGTVGSGFAFANLLGLEPKYPEMKLDSHLTPAGKALADVFRTQCQTPAYFALPFVPLETLFVGGRNPADIPAFQQAYDDNVLGREAPKANIMITSCARDDSPMSLVPAREARELAATYQRGGAQVTYAPSDCSMLRMMTDLYGWGTDLFGMQTIDWIDHQFTK